jgi:site-specific recombinase XerD
MSVYKRGTSWYIDIHLGGVRINRKAGNTRRSAKDAEAELKTKFRLRQLHLTDITNDITFGLAANGYLEHIKKTKSARTFDLDWTDYNKHLKTVFGNWLLQDIDSNMILAFQERQKSAGYANRTVNIHVGLVRKIMNYAKDRKYITTTDLKYPMLQERKKQHAFLTEEEFTLLKQNMSYGLAQKRIIVGKNTGLRPAELAFLEWNDVHFGLRTLKVQAKMEWKPKTNEERTVPLNNTCLRILEELYKKRKGRWVFSNSERPVKSIRKAIDNAAKKAGLEKRVTPNMLRHTFATHALMLGADVVSVQALLGHKDMATTQKYLHAINESLRRTVDIIDDEGRHDAARTGREEPEGNISEKAASYA